MKTISAPGHRSVTKAWVRALELTAPIPSNPQRVFSSVIGELAERFGDTLALVSDAECFTYRALWEQSNRYARWALEQGLSKGEAVCLLMPNRPEYMAIWLGITAVGGVVSLLNTHLSGPALAHCINIVEPRHIIVAAELIDPLTTALPALAGAAKLWGHGEAHDGFACIEQDIEGHAGEPLSPGERRPLTIQDPALHIYTSGTTGLPKAAYVSHFRLMQWTHWFAGMLGTGPSDRMYNCLPMYHSVGGIVATGAVLVGGGAVVIRDKFSAHQFWNDIVRWDCTLFQYIGELCRYLLHTDVHPQEGAHRLRLCCGNGLRADIWDDFKNRFRIPQILEFYAATEGNFSLFNIDDKPGSIGRIPPFLAHRFPVTLVKFDVQKEAPIRDERGFCVRSAPNDIGEAIGKIATDPSNLGARFEGYTSKEASEQKILRNVFEPGDTWFRTGDLMRKDAKGYFYCVDRIGDTFRWKGENVSTSEVAAAICAFPGVQDATVYGVTIPGAEGRAGMAALVTRDALDLAAFRSHLIDRLPGYARPLFFRLRRELALTSTFKYTKNDLVRDGFDPAASDDVIYFNHPEQDALVRLDVELYDYIRSGQIRL
jgi:fatty-acyl-CoA synthase